MSIRLYVLGIVLLVAGLVVIEAMRPRPLDLTVRLERSGSAPFDAEVFYESLPAWLRQPVEPVGRSPFDQLADRTETERTYVFVSRSFEPDPDEAERLLEFVERGNTIFVATQDIGGAFADSLGIPDPRWDTEGLAMLYPDLVDFGLGRAELGADSLRLLPPGVAGVYDFPVDVQRRQIVGLDPGRTDVLGTGPDGDEPSFVRIRWGSGSVLVSSTPLAFSNAALTGDGEAAAYVAAVLAAFPDQPVWWDDRYKPRETHAQTPLRFVLSTPALRWAYGLLLLAGVLFLAFRGRRWQRPVPVIAPPPNAQREFARTVGRLHFVHRNDARLGRQLARSVRDRLRSDLRIEEPAWDDATARLAAARAGVPEDEALGLFRTLARVHRQPGEVDLVQLDTRIARFFRYAEGPSRTHQSSS